MARRRLNKKVALLGSAVLLLLAMAAVFVFLRLNRDPAPFIADGDVAWSAGNYPVARENYARAYALSDDPEMKVELLFKLSDVYKETGQWDRVLACWETIVTTDPGNVKAHLGKVKYFYILADSLGSAGRAASAYWEEVLAQARKALDVVEHAGLLNAKRADWEPSLGPVKEYGWKLGAPALGPHLHFVKGRAATELAGMGAVTTPAELLQEAEADLQEARKLDSANAQVHYFLAQVFVERGKLAASAGSKSEQEAADTRVDEILNEGLRAAGDSPEAHIHVLARKLSMVQRGTISTAREQMKALEPEYEGLTQRFASSPRAHAAKAQFYSFFAAYLNIASALDKLDRAIAAVEQAGALDKGNSEYAILAAGYQYRRASLRGDASSLQTAIGLVERALELPDAQDTPGPTQIARRSNRLSLCSLLARCCVERVSSLSPSDPAKEDLLARAEKAVRQIEQIQGSGENPEVLKWRGMLDLARGRTGKAVNVLYTAYEQNKAAYPPEQRDSFLAQTLAMIFKDTAETGAVIEFLGSALNSGIISTRPDVLLDYGDALLQAGSYDAVINAVKLFEDRFGGNGRSQVLGVKALIAKGHVTEAEEAITRLKADDPQVLLLNLELVRAKTTQLLSAIRQEQTADATNAMTAELREHHRREADLTQRLLQADPNAVEEKYVIRLCESLIEQKDPGAARALVETFLSGTPDSLGILFYKGLLAEPDPASCSESRRREIQEQAIKSLSDPVRRALELGLFYRQAEQWEQATAQWRAVLDATTSQETQDMPAYLKIRNISPRHVAAGHLFDLARHREDWKLAEEIVDLAKRESLDDCGGSLFAARLAFAKQQYDVAMNRLNECLKQRPIFSYGYMLRGNVKAAMGKEPESIEDIRQASRLNPMDPVIAKAVASALYVRNNKLGSSASAEQALEVRQALERAIHLNPRDVPLLSVYADFIGDDDPMKAMAIRQTIQVNAPNVQNAVLLGKLATQTARREADAHKKKAFFLVAEAAFQQARQMEPTNSLMLEGYAAYFRAIGQPEKATQLLAESSDSRLLWRHHFRLRDFGEAQRLLTKMYAEPGSKVDALKGLLLVAEETSDRQGVKKHAEELISLEDSAVNRLAQLRAYLNVGLVSEAEQRLQSLKEKYPGEPRTIFMEAQVAKRRGQLSRAMQLVGRGLENDQQNAAGWRLRGEISLLMGDEDRAILDFRRSRELLDDPATTVALAKAYLWADRDEEAIAELKQAVQQPTAPREAVTLLESTYRRLGRKDALQELYADALTESPESLFWLNRAGASALAQGRPEQAEEFFGKACRLQQAALTSQDTTQVRPDAQRSAALDGYFRALILGAGDPAATAGAWRPEKLDRVLQEGAGYVETPYAPVVLFRMAEAKKKLGDAAAAREYCRKAADKAWSNPRLAVEVLLRVYMLLGDQEVTSYCRERLASEPDSVTAHFILFSLAQIQDKYEESIRHIDTCIQLAGPDSDAGVEYLVRKADLLTTAYKKISDTSYLEKAVAAYESLRVKMPKNSSVLNNLAYMLAQSDRRLPEALEYAVQAVQQSPDLASHRDTYAYVLYKNGKYAEAAEAVTAAIQQYEVEGGTPMEAYEHLGMIGEALGQPDKARAAYRRALEVGQDAVPSAVKQRIDAAIRRLSGASGQ